jgi:hypothetical protein
VLDRYAADDPAAQRWFAAARGIASGPSDLLTGLLSDGLAWPEVVGFDFASIHRAIAFGTPPANGTALIGSFDPAAIVTAYEGRGYTSTPVGRRTLLCPAAGCDTGQEVDLADRDPGVPFGGRLGRKEPLAVSATELLSSADIGVIEQMLATADADAPSLADVGPLRAVASAAADDLVLIQATLLPASLMMGAPDLAGMIGATPAEAEALLHELDGLAPLAPALAAAIVDGATSTDQVVTIALAYPEVNEASAAAEAIAGRLATVRSIARDVPLSDLLEERGVTSVATRVSEPGPDGWVAAVVALRAPLADDESTDSGGLAPSSALYRLFLDLVQSRDLLWLAPAAPAN